MTVILWARREGCRHRAHWGHAPVVAGAAATVLLAAVAHAGNAAEPRVPPTFLGDACIEVLHPGDAPLRVTIGIPNEELEATDDEPPGTRSFQFFAACREPFPGEELPPWIDVADIEAAQLANPEILTPGDALVLPTSRWASCLRPITGRDPRMPITCDGTAAGFTVAADALPPGNHVLYGYTYEPDKNIWTPRAGVLRVVGEAGEEALPPAVAFSYPVSDAVASLGVGMTLTGCAAGTEGTVVEFAWATASDLIAFGDEAWETFHTLPLAPDADTFAVPFLPPQDAAYKVVKFRALAVAPDGAQWAAYTRQPTVLEPGCAAPADGLEIVADYCGVSDGTPEPTDAGGGAPATDVCSADGEDTGTDGATDTTADGAGEDSEGSGDGTEGSAGGDGEDSGAGCGCRTSDSGGPGRRGWKWISGLLVAIVWARGLSRRRSATPARPRPATPRQ